MIGIVVTSLLGAILDSLVLPSLTREVPIVIIVY